MYFLFHCSSKRVLTVKRWAGFHDLQQKEHSLIAFSDKQTIQMLIHAIKQSKKSEYQNDLIMVEEQNLVLYFQQKAMQKAPGNIAHVLLGSHEFVLTHKLTSSMTVPSSTYIPLAPQKNQKQKTAVATEQIPPPIPILPQIPIPPPIPPTEKCSVGTSSVKQTPIRRLVGMNYISSYPLTNDIHTLITTYETILSTITEINQNYHKFLKKVDLQIEDELHFIEFSQDENIKTIELIYTRLKDLRVKRRYIKDYIVLAESMSDLLSNDYLKKLYEMQTAIHKLENRSYLLRDPDSFCHDAQ